MQSSSQNVTANKPTTNFIQACCLTCRPTSSVEALKGKIWIWWKPLIKLYSFGGCVLYCWNWLWLTVVARYTHTVSAVQDIRLKDIIKVELTPPPSAGANAPKHVFEIHTAETKYYIGEHCSEKDRSGGATAEENGCGVECAQRMAKSIRQAWLPITSEPADAAVTGRAYNCQSGRGGFFWRGHRSLAC